MTGRRPTEFQQVVGPNGTIDAQLFDGWVVVFEYPPGPHQLLGIAATAKVIENLGTQKHPELGEVLATGILTQPSTFAQSSFNYPLVPSEIVVEEDQMRSGQSIYKGRLRFQPSGDASRRSGVEAVVGTRVGEYLVSWPMFNYVIERRLSRGSSGAVFAVKIL